VWYDEHAGIARTKHPGMFLATSNRKEAAGLAVLACGDSVRPSKAAALEGSDL
jgi:hypothetical protein